MIKYPTNEFYQDFKKHFTEFQIQSQWVDMDSGQVKQSMVVFICLLAFYNFFHKE